MTIFALAVGHVALGNGEVGKAPALHNARGGGAGFAAFLETLQLRKFRILVQRAAAQPKSQGVDARHGQGGRAGQQLYLGWRRKVGLTGRC